MTKTELEAHEDAQEGAAILMGVALKFSDLDAVTAITARLAEDEAEGLPFTRRGKLALRAGRMVLRANAHSV